MGMHFLSTSHNYGYVNNLKNRYCLIQLSKTQFLWAVGNTLYQLNKISEKANKAIRALFAFVLSRIWLDLGDMALLSQ